MVLLSAYFFSISLSPTCQSCHSVDVSRLAAIDIISPIKWSVLQKNVFKKNRVIKYNYYNPSKLWAWLL